jgi:hypothetical protein
MVDVLMYENGKMRHVEMSRNEGKDDKVEDEVPEFNYDIL